MNMKRLHLILVAGLINLLPISLAHADQLAPVVDVTQNSVDDTTNVNGAQPQDQDTSATTTYAEPASPAVENDNTESLPLDQRVERLNQQMKNLTAMNLPQQIADLQQKIEQLQGQLQTEQHDSTQLSNQQRSLYADLDQRLTQLSATRKNQPITANAATKSSATPMQDSTAYQTAFNLLLKKQYGSAKQALTHYIDTYPNGQFLASAHFWLGEIYVTQKDYSQASNEFNTVINQFPTSNKVSDAKLKLAVIHVHQGNLAQARTELQNIKKQYPGTTIAQLANIQLEQLPVSSSDTTN